MTQQHFCKPSVIDCVYNTRCPNLGITYEIKIQFALSNDRT